MNDQATGDMVPGESCAEDSAPEAPAGGSGKSPGRVRTALQLVRFPAVFTALADICLGFLLNHRNWSADPQSFGLLLAASSGLYLAGMALNDVFDLAQDARERPFRPIPSGRIARQKAAVLGAGLMLGGISCAALVSVQALLIATGLAACVLLYDGILKKTPAGPVAMGGCRFLNIMLGASAQSSWIFVWRPESVLLAICLGVYTAGVTLFARNEAADRSSRWSLIAGAGVINLGLVGFMLWVNSRAWPEGQLATVALLAMVTINLNTRLYRAVRSAEPAMIQPTVRLLLLSIIVIDASLVFYKTGDVLLATMTVALLLPALTVGRWIYVT
ncbi:MAG: UbiA family prenyltransferase [Planctomycetaceae bacterium]|nr:UbiA family prenyltransferase [Planctomycetaceae bacterium]